MLEKVPGARADIRAKVVDFNETGIRIHLSLPLRVNQVIVVKSQGVEVVPARCANARVVDCRALAGTGYTAGLTFESEENSGSAPGTDYYEILQVHAKAETQTIHRIYRVLAQRFHPDNAHSGDAKMFQAIGEAYQVLSDPQKRAAYDMQLESQRKFKWRVFDQREAVPGKVAEKSMRRAILEMLYTARLSQPHQAAVRIQELEKALGGPRQQLEFSLWYLKENGLVKPADKEKYSITSKGVDHVEAENVSRTPGRRLLATVE